MKKIVVFIFTNITLLVACNNEDRVAAEPTPVYKDYQVQASEESAVVTVRLQFRKGSKNGPTLVWQPPAKVAVDGLAVQADSFGKVGSFYEVQQPAAGFGGEHTIQFWDEKGKLHRQAFSFLPFTISEIPAVVNRTNFVLQIVGVKDGTPLHLILTDTSFSNNDINEIDTVRQGSLTVTKEKWSALTSGPIQLQLLFNKQETIREKGRRTGQLLVSYSLQREFILEE